MSLAFVRGIKRWPVNSQHKGPVTQKMFPFDDVIMKINQYIFVIGRSPQQGFLDHAFMLHCTFFPHLLAQRGVRRTPQGKGAFVAGI